MCPRGSASAPAAPARGSPQRLQPIGRPPPQLAATPPLRVATPHTPLWRTLAFSVCFHHLTQALERLRNELHCGQSAAPPRLLCRVCRASLTRTPAPPFHLCSSTAGACGHGSVRHPGTPRGRVPHARTACMQEHEPVGHADGRRHDGAGAPDICSGGQHGQPRPAAHRRLCDGTHRVCILEGPPGTGPAGVGCPSCHSHRRREGHVHRCVCNRLSVPPPTAVGMPSPHATVPAAITAFDSPVQPLPAFYQAQALLGIAVGALLILLPSAVVESPEPTYTAETLMRRASGVSAATAAAVANWLLLSACRRGRLGASTFRTLNTAICATNATVRCPYAHCHSPSAVRRRPGSAPPGPPRAGSMRVPRCGRIKATRGIVLEVVQRCSCWDARSNPSVRGAVAAFPVWIDTAAAGP